MTDRYLCPRVRMAGEKLAGQQKVLASFVRMLVFQQLRKASKPGWVKDF